MLEVRRDMLVMGVRAGQFRNGGMRPVIVPVQLLITLIDLVAVGLQEATIEVKGFSNSQVDVALEKDLASDYRRQGVEANKDQSAISHRWKLVRNVIDELFVLFQCKGHLFPQGIALASGSSNLLSGAATFAASLKSSAFN
jgi:hypothetical protein